MGLALVLLLVLAAVLGAVLAIALRSQRAGTTRRSHDPTIDPFAVGEPWRRLVQSAIRSQARYRAIVDATPSPTLRATLHDIAERVDQAVAECWLIARRGDQLGDVLDGMAIARTREQLAAIDPASTVVSEQERAAALHARVDAYDRVAATSAATEARLRLLVARLDETVARGAELSLTGGDPAAAGLGSDVAGVVDELEALRLAFDELGPG